MTGPDPPRQQRTFSLTIYLALVFGLSWPFYLASVLKAKSLLAVYGLNSTAMVMVAVGTFVYGRYVLRDGFSEAGWRWGRPAHYALVIGLALALWAAPTIADLAQGFVSIPGHLSQMQIAWVFLLLFVTLVPGFGEEFGWRGYMLPRLALRMSPRKAVLTHALIWWAWHLPILANTIYSSIVRANASGASAAVSATLIVLVSAIPATMHGVVFAYIWTRTRSLAVATVYHAAYDGVRDSLQITLGHGPITQFWPIAFLTFLGLALLWKGDWRGLGRGEAK